jgi:hypothetical protein
VAKLALVPRGKPSRKDRSLLGDWQNNTRAWLIGRSLPGRRTAAQA